MKTLIAILLLCCAGCCGERQAAEIERLRAEKQELSLAIEAVREAVEKAKADNAKIREACEQRNDSVNQTVDGPGSVVVNGDGNTVAPSR